MGTAHRCPVCGGDAFKCCTWTYNTRCRHCGMAWVIKSDRARREFFGPGEWVEEVEDRNDETTNPARGELDENMTLREVLGFGRDDGEEEEGELDEESAARRALYDIMVGKGKDVFDFDVDGCRARARSLLRLVPDAYFARFALTAVTGDAGKVAAFLSSSSDRDARTYGLAVIEFVYERFEMGKSLYEALRAYSGRIMSDDVSEIPFTVFAGEYKGRNRAYDFNEPYICYADGMAVGVSRGVYDPSHPRDVFVAYDRENDFFDALSLCRDIENAGYTCFMPSPKTFPIKWHDDYERDVEAAMDSCGTFAFVSTGYSRRSGSEAFRELMRVMDRERKEHAGEVYDYIPQDRLKPRFEFADKNCFGNGDYLDEYLCSMEALAECVFHDDEHEFRRRESRAEGAVKSFFHGLWPAGGHYDGWWPDGEDYVSETLDSHETHSRCGTSDEIKDILDGRRKGRLYGRDSTQMMILDDDPFSFTDRPFIFTERYQYGPPEKKEIVDDPTNKALRHVKALAKAGKVWAQQELQNYYSYLYDPSPKEMKGGDPANMALVRHLEAAAEAGDSHAQYNLACCYHYGTGVERDLVKAAGWFACAAEEGNAVAQYNLACCYYDGIGVERDTVKAAEWLERAALRGCSKAGMCLAFCYRRGIGVEKDSERELYWCRRAAERGNADAMCLLGYFYRDGRGVPRDYAAAARWYRRAAERGHPDAMYCLGLCYHYGSGVKKDEEEVDRCFHAAYSAGSYKAEMRLFPVDRTIYD